MVESFREFFSTHFLCKCRSFYWNYSIKQINNNFVRGMHLYTLASHKWRHCAYSTYARTVFISISMRNCNMCNICNEIGANIIIRARDLKHFLIFMDWLGFFHRFFKKVFISSFSDYFCFFDQFFSTLYGFFCRKSFGKSTNNKAKCLESEV
jgi:hypothetical protein